VHGTNTIIKTQLVYWYGVNETTCFGLLGGHHQLYRVLRDKQYLVSKKFKFVWMHHGVLRYIQEIIRQHNNLLLLYKHNLYDRPDDDHLNGRNM